MNGSARDREPRTPEFALFRHHGEARPAPPKPDLLVERRRALIEGPQREFERRNPARERPFPAGGEKRTADAAPSRACAHDEHVDLGEALRLAHHAFRPAAIHQNDEPQRRAILRFLGDEYGALRPIDKLL